jgi:hypothetical protein
VVTCTPGETQADLPAGAGRPTVVAPGRSVTPSGDRGLAIWRRSPIWRSGGPRYAEPYAAFRDRYCHLEDGRATARVVDRFFRTTSPVVDQVLATR